MYKNIRATFAEKSLILGLILVTSTLGFGGSMATETEVENSGTTNALEGKTYEYTYSSGASGRLNFSNNKANWEWLSGPQEGATGANDYMARQVGENSFFLRWYEPEFDVLLTMLIDEGSRKVYSSFNFNGALEFDVATIHSIENQR